MSFASTLRQSQFSLLQYLFQDLNQALCFCLRHIITSPFKFTIQRYFCPYFQYPPPRNFAKIHARGGRGLLPVQPKDSIPPWGHSGTRRRGAAAVPESSGRRRTGGGVPRRTRGGRRFAGAARARRSAGARGAGAFLPGGGGKPGAGGLARVRRTKAAWRARRRGAGNVAGRRGAGGLRGFPGRTRGRRGGRRAARPGRLPVAGARRATAREKRLHPARLV